MKKRLTTICLTAAFIIFTGTAMQAQWNYVPNGGGIQTYNPVAINYHTPGTSKLFVWGGDATFRGPGAKIVLGDRNNAGWNYRRDWSISVDSFSNTNYGLRFFNHGQSSYVFQLMEKYGSYTEPVALLDGSMEIYDRLKVGAITGPVTVSGVPAEAWGGAVLKVQSSGTAAGNSSSNTQLIAGSHAEATTGVRFSKTGTDVNWILSSRFGNTESNTAASNRFSFYYNLPNANPAVLRECMTIAPDGIETAVGINQKKPGGTLHINGTNTAPDIVLTAYNNWSQRVRLVNNGSNNFGISVGQNSNGTPNEVFAIHPKPGGQQQDLDYFHMDFKGAIFCRKLEINAAGTVRPDYVFEKDHKLMSLEELEKFIQEKKHLPGLASASEVDQRGSVDLLQLNYQLLEKVEELTLYIIQLKKELQKTK